MSWWRRARDPDPEPAVTEEDRHDVEELRGWVDSQRARVDEVAGEARSRAGFLRRERTEVNHLAERMRRALEGLS